MEYDCIIVGGGPAGTTLARSLSRSADVLVLEEHVEVGRPVQCAGIISPRSVELAGYPKERCHPLKCATIHGPKGTSTFIESKGIKAVTVDRDDLDRFLWNDADASGAECRNGVRYLRHRETPDRITVETTSGTFTGRVLVGADGVSSPVARHGGFPRIREIMPTLGVDVPGRLDIGADVRIDLGKDVSPDFFGWVLPRGTTTRIQIGSGSYLPSRLLGYLKRLSADGSVLGFHTGTIPLKVRERFTKGRIALLGDSAGQVKPLSGGGIYPLLTASEILADELLRNGFDGGSLATYESRVRSGLGRELARGTMLRDGYNRVSDRTVSKALEYFSRDDIRSVIEKEGDIDHPSALARTLLSRFPIFLGIAPSVARDLFDQ